MKANGTRWGWQIPRFGSSELQIRWSGQSIGANIDGVGFDFKTFSIVY